MSNNYPHPPNLRKQAHARCDRKRAFRSRQKAAQLAAQQSAKTGKWIVAYQCFECGHFHIGRAEEDQYRVLDSIRKAEERHKRKQNKYVCFHCRHAMSGVLRDGDGDILCEKCGKKIRPTI